MVKDIEPDDTMDFDYSPDIDQRRDSYFPPAGSAAMERTMSYEPESRIQPHRPMQKLHTAKLLEMILKDTQSRLMYRSQAIIKNSVSGYYPKGNDLDYPAKIENGEPLDTSLNKTSVLIFVSGFQWQRISSPTANGWLILSISTKTNQRFWRCLQNRRRKRGIQHCGQRSGSCRVSIHMSK